MQFFHAVRDGNLCQTGASGKGSAVNYRNTFGNLDFLQAYTAGKSVAFDVPDAGGQLDMGQFGKIPEGVLSDLFYGIRKPDTRETGAVV